MSDLMKLTLAGARDALRAGETTAVELTEASLAAVAASKPLNAFVHDTSEIARSQPRLQMRAFRPVMRPICAVCRLA